MGLKRRMVAGLAAGALLIGAAVTGLATAAPVPAGATPARQRGTPQTVTLITGDRVTVGPDARRPLVRRGQGRDAVPFFIRRQGGHWLVLPGDALGLVTTGRLDRRLFDVTGLLADGYGDAARADVPVIVQYQRPVAGRRLAVAGATAQRELPVVRGLALHQAKRDAAKLWSSVTRKATASSPVGGAAAARRLAAGIVHVWLDSQYKLALDRSVPQIGAPAAWQAGLTGEGVNVAVLDSGVDPSHPDLAGRIAAYRDFSTDEQPGDTSGHGTPMWPRRSRGAVPGRLAGTGVSPPGHGC